MSKLKPYIPIVVIVVVVTAIIFRVAKLRTMVTGLA